MSDAPRPLRGRGAASNPANRFERLAYEPDPETAAEAAGRPDTIFYVDDSRTLLVHNDSPDVRFDWGINPYRGCEHGCSYCFARPHHEYLGFSAGLDFETRILVKRNAAELLRAELASPRWKPQPVGMSGVTDPYQPAERRLRVTRGCVEVLAAFRNPVIVITKNHLVTRDLDLLGELADRNAASVYISVTTLDAGLARSMEPRTSTPNRRLEAMETLAARGVPVGVLLAPVVPGLTDHEIPSILEACAGAGAGFAGYVMLRLPHGVRDLFADWLEQHYPQRREKVLNRLRSLRDGKLYDSKWEERLVGRGAFADQVSQMFDLACTRHGLARHGPRLSTASFRNPDQPGLFDPV